MSTGKASDYEPVSQRHKGPEYRGYYPGFIQQFLFLRPYDLAEFLIVQTFKELMVRLLIAPFVHHLRLEATDLLIGQSFVYSYLIRPSQTTFLKMSGSRIVLYPIAPFERKPLGLKLL